MLLTVLAISIGHRVSLALRLSRYQRDKLKALYLAKAGMNSLIAQLNKDTNNYDALNETWANNEDLFKKIILDENQAEFATVSYAIIDEDKSIKNIYGAQDEERKLNINTSNIQLLEQLFILRGFKTDASALADIIVNWIDTDQESEDEKKAFKNGPLKAPEELLLILEYFYESREGPEKYRQKAQDAFNKVKDLITVYAGRQVNINTASLDAIRIIFKTVGMEPNIQAAPAEIEDLAARIDNYRKGSGGYFTVNDMNANEIKTRLGLGGIINNQTKIIDQIVSAGALRAVSENFLIEVTGNAGKIKSMISGIYNREDRKILFWHEN